ncbi:primase C-terminal domain-containing protein [Exiguobacterium artemiae]|uniref:primase C-terminal domain-containing protein n=1 Tax=Exiguobacterium artemiae TaxID=340145 RepID=UPI00047E0A50|nr:primase C-terminal domain-containing protein [Exiguobacterium sibiricum]
MYSSLSKSPVRQHSYLEQEVLETIFGRGIGLYDNYANNVPRSIKQKCDFELKTQGSIRVAYSKESIFDLSLGGQDIARSIQGVLHYHNNSHSGVTHFTPNTYYKAVKPSDIADENLRRVRTFGFDIDQKTSVQQILFAFEVAGIPCKPTLILKTSKGVQFFVVFADNEAWYGSVSAIQYAKAIGEAIRSSLYEQGLPIDLNNALFGWARFPREETIMYFEKENVWSKDEATEWFQELGLKRGNASVNGSWLTSKAGRALWNTDEKGTRNMAAFELSVMAKRDGYELEDTLLMMKERNAVATYPIGNRRLEKAVRSAYKKDYFVRPDVVEMICGVRPQLRGYYKHKKSKEERAYEKIEELVERTIDHLEKRLPVGEGSSLSISASQLAEEMNHEKAQVKSLTRAFKKVSKSKFIIRKKRDLKGNVVKGRYAGFVIYRTQDFMLEISSQKQKIQLPVGTYNVLCALEKTKEYASKLMCQLPKHLGTVSSAPVLGLIYTTGLLPGPGLWWLSE